MENLFTTTGTTSGTYSVLGPGITTTQYYDYSAVTNIVTASSVISVDDLMIESETKTHFVWKRVIPGVKPTDLNAFVRNGSLIVEVDSDKEYLFEMVIPKEISLDIDNDDYNQDDIELDLTDGILIISIAKATPDKQLTVK